MSDYNYSISGDFLNGKVASPKLHDEIAADPAITISLSGINTNGDTCTCSFHAALPTADKTALDAVIASHDGVPGLEKPLPVTIEPTGDLSKVIRIQGHGFTATKDTTTTHDISWGYDVELQGMDVWTNDKHVWGDHVEVTLQHPNPAVGELGKFGENTWIHPSGDLAVVAEGTQTIPAGLILRLEYTSVGTVDDVEVQLNIRLWL